MSHSLARASFIGSAALAIAVLPVLGDDRPAGILRDNFETGRTVWKSEETDVTVNLLDHDRSKVAAHDGGKSERFHFEAGPGSAIYYSYSLPKVPIVDSLEVNLYAKSDHSGVQLFGRVILPADTDPDTGQPSFVLIPGTVLEATDRWQRLTLPELRDEIDRRVRILRARTKRPVKVEGAYLEQLVVNLYGGPGETLVYLDELSISPVPEDLTAEGANADARPLAGDGAAKKDDDDKALPAPPSRASDRIVLDRNRLSKDGFDWTFSAIRAPGADLKELRRYGFDVLSVDLDGELKTARDGANYGFMLMPDLGASPTGGIRSATDTVAAAAAYPLREKVAFWNLGDRLGSSNDASIREAERDRVRAEMNAFRHAPDGFSHLTTGGVAGMFPDYERRPQNLDLIGVHPQSWGTTQEMKDFEIYLSQRRDLTAVRNPGALHWTWIPATPPEEVHQAVWGFEMPPALGVARVQPEQLRLYAYAVLSAGYRGLGFRGDADLTRASGRPLLIEMALLNAEIDLMESVIAQGFDPIPLLPTFPADPPVIIIYTSPGVGGQSSSSTRSAKSEAKKRPEMPALATVKAAAISTKDNKGKLLIVTDFALGSQWQPPQMAINDLKIRIPGAPESAQAYEINLGSVKVLDRIRVPGGMQVSLDDFGPTSLILVTTDQELVARIQQAVASVRSIAIPMAIEQAQLQLQWVSEINRRLAADGHKIKDAADLLEVAEDKLKAARDALEREDYAMAWAEARRAGRPLRLVMRDHWDKALAELVQAATPAEERKADAPKRPTVVYRTKKEAAPTKKRYPARIVSPVSFPPMLSFSTIPQAYIWNDWIKDAKFAANLLPSGSFDDPDALSDDGWLNEGYPIDGVSASITSVEGGPGKSKRALKFTVEPAKKGGIDALPAYLDHPVAALRSPAVDVTARQLLRISVKAKMSRQMPPGAGGLIVRDSLGGEPLQYRTTDPIADWSEIILFRRAPADGPFTVTLGLAGFGEAYFDDLRIEPIAKLGPAASESGTTASTDRSPAARLARPRPSTRPPVTGEQPTPRTSPTARLPQSGRIER